MAKGRLTLRTLLATDFHGLPTLDLINEGAGEATVYFRKSVDSAQVLTLPGVDSASLTSVNGAPIARFTSVPENTPGEIREPHFFAGQNVAIATRNAETVDMVIEWLTYHYRYFDMHGAVIFNRAAKGSDDEFIEDLEHALSECGYPVHVILVESPSPLGDPSLPPETHQFCVSEAPGRDRMEVPPADPWLSPLTETTIYEIARTRFVGEARAFANIDICDLLYAPVDALLDHQKGKRFATVFDLAAENPGAIVELLGQHCYPWRVRKGQEPRFADHSCVQFDKPRFRQRWCAAPESLGPGATLKVRRISNIGNVLRGRFYRNMAIRHPVNQTSLIVPKTSLVEAPELVRLAKEVFAFKPVPVPKVETRKTSPKEARTAIITTMKNEGPFILEWIAYHQAIGVKDFLIYTNDCTDGTDTMFDLLQSKGIVQHRQNPFREMELKPQHAALQAAEDEKLIKNADWIICMDVDEFLNIKVGNGTLSELYEAVGDANMISCTWRLFGNSDLHDFHDEYTIGQFSRCAREFSPKPHQAWGFKTLFRNNGIFKKMGVHRPKGLKPQVWDEIRWVNGSGKPIPRHEFRNSWRSTAETYGYDLVSLNHYAVRNAESFLVKRDRGRVNHVDRDQGLAYWFRMNNNADQDLSIQKRIPMMEEKLRELMADPEIAAMHAHCVKAHRDKITELKAQPAQIAFFETLTGDRMQKLSRMHRHFGANVFLSGPESVPDEIVREDHPDDFYFTVERTETQH